MEGHGNLFNVMVMETMGTRQCQCCVHRRMIEMADGIGLDRHRGDRKFTERIVPFDLIGIFGRSGVQGVEAVASRIGFLGRVKPGHRQFRGRQR